MGTVLCLAGFTCQQTGIRSVTEHQKFAVLVMEQELFGEMTRLNREVIFRGFHPCEGPDTIVVDGEKVKGEWVYGWYCEGVFGNYPFKETIIPDQDARGGLIEYAKVLPSTIGQYTGLKDKNGKQIFEGDRLRWDEKEWGGPFIETCSWDYGLLDVRENDWQQFCEVIGTVFDEEAE